MWQRARFLADNKDFSGRECWVRAEAPKAILDGTSYSYGADGRKSKVRQSREIQETRFYLSNLVDTVSPDRWDGWPHLFLRAGAVELLGGDGDFRGTAEPIEFRPWAMRAVESA